MFAFAKESLYLLIVPPSSVRIVAVSHRSNCPILTLHGIPVTKLPR